MAVYGLVTVPSLKQGVDVLLQLSWGKKSKDIDTLYWERLCYEEMHQSGPVHNSLKYQGAAFDGKLRSCLDSSTMQQYRREIREQVLCAALRGMSVELWCKDNKINSYLQFRQC